MNKLFAAWNHPDSPGAAIAVIHDSVIVHMRGYGMADLQQDVPITPSVPFDICSLSKQFSAMAIAMLLERGQLALDDDVRRYVPEVPDFGSPITIRHLVHHTSGLRDWVEAFAIAGWQPTRSITAEAILQWVRQERNLNFEPGKQHLYSNTGYSLLAIVVERVTGEPFDQWLYREIFQPLGMTNTRLPGDEYDPIRRSVRSYESDGAGGFRYQLNNVTAPGASSIYSTVEDMAKWILNFDSGRVGTLSVIDRMRQTGRLNNGAKISYAFGQSIGEYLGVRFVGHGGRWAGFRSALIRFPDHRFAVVVLANVANIDAERMGFEIAELYLGRHMHRGFHPLKWGQSLYEKLLL
ncbi:serine hydrolase [candidate division KSB1 bacterium]|nr:serine hydrolase [candidate division KSB1 bacterium]